MSRAAYDILNCDNFDELETECEKCLNIESVNYHDGSCITDKALTSFVLHNITRNKSGRIIVPLLCNWKASHLLGKNYSLSKQILNANFKKLQKNDKLCIVDQIFREQKEMNVIERIECLPLFIAEHPEASFLPHMPVYRPDKYTTKARVVYLSDLCEKVPGSSSLSHNQGMFADPCLNRKMTTALLQLRFDQRILCFDIVKAFLQISLNEVDQNKLNFLWYKM